LKAVFSTSFEQNLKYEQPQMQSLKERNFIHRLVDLNTNYWLGVRDDFTPHPVIADDDLFLVLLLVGTLFKEAITCLIGRSITSF
jgi:hypothetical protein